MSIILSTVISGGLFISFAYAVDSKSPATNNESISFRRDIRPVLSDHCFLCHGPDEKARQAKLRLDTKESALAVIVPGDPGKSLMIKRITASNPAARMPPPSHPRQLNAKQIDLIRRWVAEGAKWEEGHWAYIPPVRPKVPVSKSPWPKNAIDHFILARLTNEGLKPSPVADRRILIRRLSFDLTGLPPTPREVDEFVADRSPDAYENLVDRLLSSPHFGERMAIQWLDLVRYADTRGYHGDQHQDVTPYRDYVIRSLNSNKPFDQFTTEQLAGDLLKDATLEQRIASGYNKLLMTTEEGGAQAKEYFAKYAADRVRNASVVWLGSTMGCSECHDHKYDPFKTRDFYSFAAFFADVKEVAVGPLDKLPLPTEEQAAQLKALDGQIAPLRKTLDTTTPELEAAQIEWENAVRADPGKIKKDIAAILSVDPEKRSDKQKQELSSFYRTTIAPELEPVRKELEKLQAQRDAIDGAIVRTMVTEFAEPRVMRILPRGNWLNESGEIVQPAVPAFLHVTTSVSGRLTRLDLARWLTSRDNPLVARVFVNRLFSLMFGHGIVTTLDDFGSQGARPSHPELLDWLAVEFIESGWNIKAMVKLLAMSETYRQTSQESALLRQRDPGNSLFARQSRFRYDAEFVRDNALAISGLLVRTVGGQSGKPYQPEGYWDYLNFPKRTYENDKGAEQYRRGVYTYWCRTYLHPSLLAFDAATREECTVQRVRSNTPQQALVLLNDPTYVEASRVFAERIIKEGGKNPESRIRFAYREALGRSPRPEESALLLEMANRHLRQYEVSPDDATKLIHEGNHAPDPGLSAAEMAAWTSVARVILNLHETITRS